MADSLFHMNEADGHLEQALEHHAAGRNASVKRRIELARAALERAIEAHPSYQDPTAEQGAQTSDGQSPRSLLDPETRRRRDQLESCRIGYEVRRRRAELR